MPLDKMREYSRTWMMMPYRYVVLKVFNCVRHILPVPGCLWKCFLFFFMVNHRAWRKPVTDLGLLIMMFIFVWWWCRGWWLPQVLLANKLAATSDCSCLRLWILPKGDLFATLDMEVGVLRIVMTRTKTSIWKRWQWQQGKNNISCPRGTC